MTGKFVKRVERYYKTNEKKINAVLFIFFLINIAFLTFQIVKFAKKDVNPFNSQMLYEE